jgi:hypothetical protein
MEFLTMITISGVSFPSGIRMRSAILSWPGFRVGESIPAVVLRFFKHAMPLRRSRPLQRILDGPYPGGFTRRQLDAV